MIIEKVITLASGTISRTKEGFIYIKYSNYPIITIEEVKLRDNAIFELCNNQPTPLLIDTRNSLIEYSAEARDYMANSAKIYNLRTAEAFIISANNVGLKLLVQNYIKLNIAKCPVKTFKNEEDALEWIAQFISK